MNERENRVAISERTSSIDERNFSRVNDISVIAEQQLKRFDQSYKTESAADYYQKLKKEMTSTDDAPVISVDNIAYELELAESDFMPTLHEKTENIQQKSAGIVLNLRGKLIIAVTASILALLSILMIYNAVLINELNAGIVQSKQQLIIEQSKLEGLTSQLEELLEQTSLDALGLTELPAVQTNGIVSGTSESYSQPTNWFDAICNFFARLFGG